jgi:diadenosine tetraphosphate (Ap4A) HIT family hydrolase
MKYDSSNIFFKIIKGEVPCKKIYEDEAVLAFYDIHPKAKIHALVIPKVECFSFENFIEESKPETIAEFFSKVKFVASEVLGLKENFRLVINNGSSAGQEVFHFHVHILSNS